MADNLTSDIYSINDFVNEVKKQYVSENEDTLMLGIFGYFGQMFSDLIQNGIVMASEFSNESIPTKAKFEKNIIAHALGLGLTDINAVPAQMDVILTFVESDIINSVGNVKTDQPWSFTFDKDNPIYFGNFEFHVDYDILIKKVEVTTQGVDKKFTYTAQYESSDFNITNPVSTTTNPYLTSPVKISMNGIDTLLVKCTIRQVEKNTQNTKVLSNNDVSSKTITFTFTGQLAAFSLDVTEGSTTYHMVPVYEGLNVDTGGDLYFWYTYLAANTIRIKFDRNSKIPAINASIAINIQTTQGSDGNFTWVDDNPISFFNSERLGYSNITCEVQPLTGESAYGHDKKTIAELKQIIPKEALSRGSITSTADLNNYFNMLDTDYSKVYFYKKRDNCLERLYYSFIILKNDTTIIPTNTVDMVIEPEELDTEEGSDKYFLRQNTPIVLETNSNEARLLKDGETLPDYDDTNYDGRFTYYLPYDFIINKSPLYGIYFMSTIHTSKLLDFDYINENCMYQYVATSIDWNRNCLENHNEFVMTISLQQNITPEAYVAPESSEDETYDVYDSGAVRASDVTTEIDMDNPSEDKIVSEAALVKALTWQKSVDETEDETDSEDSETSEGISTFSILSSTAAADETTSDKPIYYDSEGNVICNIAVLMIVYNEEDKPLRWAKGELTDCDASLGNITFEFKFTTEDYFDSSTRLRIDTGLYDINSTYESYAYMHANMKTKLFVVSKQELEYGLGTPVLSDYIPGLEGLSLSNTYEISGGLDFFYDYSGIVSSVVTATNDMMDSEGKFYTDEELANMSPEEFTTLIPKVRYHVKGVPVVKYGYFETEDIAKAFFDELVTRKTYIDKAIDYLEDAFEMDFKFFNTYGPSKFFTWDNELEVIDRVNISLFFKLKLRTNYESNIVEDIRQDIKDYVEDINSIESLHIPNLITEITNTYKDSIVYFEFVSINGKEASYQHIYAMDMPDDIMVPEFINIDTINGLPDITIELV
jgi:hypothetical protein